MTFFTPQAVRIRCRTLPLCGTAILCAAALANGAQAATVGRYWELSPYRVRIAITLNTSAVVASRVEQQLPRLIIQRARVAFGPLWKLDVELADHITVVPDTKRAALSAEELTAARRSLDKLIVLAVHEDVLGYEVTAQEYDCLLESWGPVVSLSTTNLASLPELAFAAVQAAFSPMATFQVKREQPDQVRLKFRGSELPRLGPEQELYRPGDVLRPVLRRVDRDGQPVEGGIQVVPWTYLSVQSGAAAEATADIHSHTKFPFGARQRGRVEQLAQLVRSSDAPTTLRLHARGNQRVALAGLPVYQRNLGEEDSTFLGKTDRDGRITVPPGDTPIQFVFVQSSGQWIAKIPVVPGADGLVEAPLVDDRKRLEAEARLIAIREELIDIVARRNILAMRVRTKIKEGDLDAANRLVREIEALPSATEFEQQRIRQQERLVTSDDPRVQARIDQLFGDTRDVLAEFLSPGLVQELKREIAAGSTAQR